MGGLWLSLATGMALLLVGADELCWMLGRREDSLAQEAAYTRTVAIGVPGMLLIYAANGIFRELQKVRITLVVTASGAVVGAAFALTGCASLACFNRCRRAACCCCRHDGRPHRAAPARMDAGR